VIPVNFFHLLVIVKILPIRCHNQDRRVKGDLEMDSLTQHMSNATSKSLSLTIAAVAAVAILLTIAIFPAAGMAGIAQYRHRSIAYAQQQQPSPQSTNASASASNTATNAITVVISSGASVNQTNQYFVPNSIQVSSGSNVTWINNDTAAHTATAGNPQQALRDNLIRDYSTQGQMLR
jgi:plastocyanin